MNAVQKFLSNGVLLSLTAVMLFSAYDGGMKYVQAVLPLDLALFSGVIGSCLSLFLLGLVKHDWHGFIPKRPAYAVLFALTHIISLICILYLLHRMQWVDLQVFIFCLPLLTTLVAKFTLHENISLRHGVGLFLAVCGVALSMQIWHIFTADSFLHYDSFLYVLVIIWLGLHTVRSLLVKTVLVLEKPQSLSFTSSAMFLAYFVLSGKGFALFHYDPYFTTIGILGGFLGTTGMVLYIRAQQRAPLSIVVPMTYSQIIWTATFGYLIWAETPTLPTILGAILVIMGGLVIYAYRPKSAKLSAISKP